MKSWKILMRTIPPENPTISEPTLRSITMVPGEVNVEYNSLIDVYRVELKNTIYEEIKSTSEKPDEANVYPYTLSTVRDNQNV